jgi:hypothetical protein
MESTGTYPQPDGAGTAVAECDDPAPDAGRGIPIILNGIRAEQARIDNNEGDVVASMIRIGRHLGELRKLARRDWGKRLKEVQINPRVASRYTNIAKSCLGEIGLNESDSLPRLPPDLLKLEWLCKLDREHLESLLDKLDCKKAARRDVIAAVKEILGIPDSERGVDPEKLIKRGFQRMVKAVGQLMDDEPDPTGLQRLGGLIDTGVQQLRDALGSSTAATAATAASD